MNRRDFIKLLGISSIAPHLGIDVLASVDFQRGALKRWMADRIDRDIFNALGPIRSPGSSMGSTLGARVWSESWQLEVKGKTHI
jgi:hypothetical protein